MIHGTVNEYREACVALRLRGPTGSETVVPAIVDSGYNGTLTLAADIVSMLALPQQSSSLGELADGSLVTVNVHNAKIEWGNSWRPISVSAIGEESLVGMRLLLGNELKIVVIPGGDVSITPLPGTN